MGSKCPFYGEYHIFFQYLIGDAVYCGGLVDSDTDPVTDHHAWRNRRILFLQYIPNEHVNRFNRHTGFHGFQGKLPGVVNNSVYFPEFFAPGPSVRTVHVSSLQYPSTCAPKSIMIASPRAIFYPMVRVGKGWAGPGCHDGLKRGTISSPPSHSVIEFIGDFFFRSAGDDLSSISVNASVRDLYCLHDAAISSGSFIAWFLLWCVPAASV